MKQKSKNPRKKFDPKWCKETGTISHQMGEESQNYKDIIFY